MSTKSILAMLEHMEKIKPLTPQQKVEKVEALRKKFRDQFCIPGSHFFHDAIYEREITARMVEDFWLHEMGLLPTPEDTV